MDCDGCREAMSAALDGEADAAEQARIDAHLDGCPACRSWQRDAALVTRHARTAAVGAGPDLVDRVVGAAPRPRCGGAGCPRGPGSPPSGWRRRCSGSSRCSVPRRTPTR
ncbi:zf-HC2 domain-containing protein [Actinomycetospora sp. CA-053990]|uniref:zf-HC2 domain-containing protein n=1 Tax=Actinomycetospora sp. CA-053990 TaxID=3239891 RepID=UPI003D89D863